MKAMRDAAGLLIVILVLLSVRVGPPAGPGTDLIPTAQAATASAADPSEPSGSNLYQPASEAPLVLETEFDRCPPSIVTFRDAQGAEKLVIVRVETDFQNSEVRPEPRKPRACQIG